MRRSGFIQIDCSEVLDEIEDDVLLDEVHRRDLDLETVGDLEDMRRIYDMLLTGRTAEAICVLDRILHPKWKSIKKCKELYLKVRNLPLAS